ncbi:hypothetical protein [Chelatococcus reniformis]|nr:hypothetical protein [Chelatococcus reniformis]
MSTRNTMIVVTVISALAAIAVVQTIPHRADSRPVQPALELTPRSVAPAVVASPDTACKAAGVRMVYAGYGEACSSES